MRICSEAYRGRLFCIIFAYIRGLKWRCVKVKTFYLAFQAICTSFLKQLYCRMLCNCDVYHFQFKQYIAGLYFMKHSQWLLRSKLMNDAAHARLRPFHIDCRLYYPLSDVTVAPLFSLANVIWEQTTAAASAAVWLVIPCLRLTLN